jgi:hypothetical protein
MKYRKKSTLPGFPFKAKLITKNDIDEYFSNPEGIQCLLCGRIYKSLNGHLQAGDGRWGSDLGN